MKTLAKKIFILSFLLVVSAACDDFVDINPKYTQDAENYFKSPEDYDKALTGAYDLLQTSFINIWIGEIASDDAIAGGESPTDTEGLHQIDDMKQGGVNNELREVFRWNYAGITRTNYIFENKDNIDFPGKDNILAQAAFLRAYYYFQLVKYFGAVPLVVDKRLGIDEVRSIPRTPAKDVYAQIEKDLQYAAGILDWTAAEKGRVTKGAALSLLGRVYLYENKFKESADALETVITKGPYALVSDYASQFRVATEQNSETVFDAQYTGLEGGSYSCFVCLEGNPAVGFDGIRGYTGPVYGDGNSYNLPTQNLVDAFDPSDPRLDASVLDIEKFIAAQPNPGDISYVKGAGGHTGYYNNKYIKRSDELGQPDTDLTSPMNYHIIRFADVLLMAAEANNRKASPDDGKARTYLNMVRQRAGMPDITTSGSQLTQDIWHERRLELSGEGFRFFDLVRTGQAASKIAGFKTGKNELFPIPQDEIDLAGGNWKQNPGY